MSQMILYFSDVEKFLMLIDGFLITSTPITEIEATHPFTASSRCNRSGFCSVEKRRALKEKSLVCVFEITFVTEQGKTNCATKSFESIIFFCLYHLNIRIFVVIVS